LSFIILERLLPAKQSHWCFCTWPGAYPHTLDNPRAVFEEVKNDTAIVKIILSRRQVPSSSPFVLEGENVVLVEAESARGAYYLAISKVVILGYSMATMTSYSKFLTSKHKIVQLSHGVLFKRSLRLFPGEQFWEKETPKYAATVCSSESDLELMAQAFSPVPKENVWLTGLPRNDLLLKNENELPGDYRSQLENLRRMLGGRRLVLYAPTWRDNAAGMYALSDPEKEALAAILTRRNAVFGIRAHANRRTETPDSARLGADRILYVNDFPDVNVVLRLTDVLVTDYSSIYIDFLLTNKPILHFTYDLPVYMSERGFVYDFDQAVASPWFASFESLLTRLDEALSGVAIQNDQYHRAKQLFHTHGDRSALRVAQRIRTLAQ
jgi:CDP-glycerol glycerophosphotransferase